MATRYEVKVTEIPDHMNPAGHADPLPVFTRVVDFNPVDIVSKAITGKRSHKKKAAEQAKLDV